jgi:hypothetical protein
MANIFSTAINLQHKEKNLQIALLLAAVNQQSHVLNRK